MAPKRNQAKAQRGSFLTRGREQLRQRQQTRQQASRQLPPQGGTTAGSPKARGQRVATAVSQRVTQDVATIRALADNMRRNQARADRQIPADKSPSVRRVGPGGANPKPQGQLPPGQRGGDIRQKGGPLATRDKGGPVTQRGGGMTRTNNGGPIREVSVSDMGNTPQRRLPGQRGLPGGTGGADRVTASGARTGQPGPNRNALPGGQRSLPPSQPSARRQAAQAKADAAARGSEGPTRVGQPAGSANRMYGANRVNAAVDRAMSQQRGTRANVAGAVVSALAQPLVDRAAARGGRNLAKALTPVGRAIDDALPGMNSKDERSRKTNTPYQTRFPQARANAQVRVNRIKAGTPDAAPQPNRTSQASTPQRPQIASSTPTRSRSTQPVSSTTSRSSAPSTTTPAPTERRVSAATANRESGNYGTSRSDNKLLGDFLRQRMAQRESQTSTNAVGPVKDGNTYAGNLNKPTGRGPVSNGNEYGNMLKIDKMKKDKKK